jgi:hypothetical protein
MTWKLARLVLQENPGSATELASFGAGQIQSLNSYTNYPGDLGRIRRRLESSRPFPRPADYPDHAVYGRRTRQLETDGGVGLGPDGCLESREMECPGRDNHRDGPERDPWIESGGEDIGLRLPRTAMGGRTRRGQRACATPAVINPFRFTSVSLSDQDITLQWETSCGWKVHPGNLE